MVKISGVPMKVLTTIAATSFFLLFTATNTEAQPQEKPQDQPEVKVEHVDGVEVVDYGIYVTDFIRTKNAQGAIQSVWNRLRHVRTTREVPAERRIHFGLRFKLLGEPNGTKAILKKVWIFPPQGVWNPTTGRMRHQYEKHMTVTVGEMSYTAYKFDKPWQRVPGPWTLELWHKGRRLVSQHFTVFQP